jgi:hypothetical protein
MLFVLRRWDFGNGFGADVDYRLYKAGLQIHDPAHEFFSLINGAE